MALLTWVLVRNKGMDTFLTHFGHQLLRNVRNMSKICPKHVQLLNVSKFCPKGVHNRVKCPKSIQTYGHVLDIFLTIVQSFWKCPISVQNMSKMCPKYDKNYGHVLDMFTIFQNILKCPNSVPNMSIMYPKYVHV